MKSLRAFAYGAFCVLIVALVTASLIDRPQVPEKPGERVPQSVSPTTEKKFEVGRFRVSLALRGERVLMKVEESNGRVVWDTPSDAGFATVVLSRLRYDDRHQSYAVEFTRGKVCSKQTLDRVLQERGALVLEGRFSDTGCELPYRLVLSEPKPRDLELRVDLKHELTDSPNDVDRDLVDLTKKLLPKFPVMTLHGRTRFSEAIFGAGAQMTYFDLKGKFVPLIVREQGIGRGLAHPLLRGLELVAPGASGDATSTYAPSPVFVTSENRSVVLENYEPAAFDFRKLDRASISVRSGSVVLHVLPRESVPDAVTALTEYTGRMKPLPDWFNDGVTLGLQGGPRRVLRALENAKAHGVPVAGVWIQDWVGRRQIDVAGVPIGSFLWWTWESDEKTYPDWPSFVGTLARRGVRTLAYMNPYLVDASEKSGSKSNLFAEAERNGFLVRDSVSGRAWIGNVIHFPASLVDLSNRRAYEWMKGIVRDRVIRAGVSGMMADFGEALPYDSRISEGVASEFHNRFPEKWARVPLDAAEEAKVGDEFVSFSRSGYLRGPASTRLFWLGDQMTTWDANDGLKSSLIGLLSGGLSGQSLNHSDIGGYTAVALNGSGIRRTKELFMRWAEMNAFTAAYRTHEGSRPDLHHQFDSDDETLAHFAKFSRVFAGLAPYRKALMREAWEKGWPLVRPMAFYHPTDVRIRNVTTQFYFGADALVAPVLDSRATKVKMWMPEGEWIHLWSGKRSSVTKAGWISVDAPVGQPAVFYRSGSAFARDIAEKIKSI